jgi:methionyl-tRNA formyltransferase
VARLAFLGSPDAAVAPLEALVAAGHDVTLVVSRADTRRGRGKAHTPSPVKRAALALGISVDDDLEAVSGAGAELGVVVAYGRILPKRLLDAVPMVNVHFSLLPRWRGAAPVERAVLAGDAETGVSLMRLEEGLDTGPVVATVAVEVGVGEHAAALTRRLSVTGAQLLVNALAGGVDALGPGTAQQGTPTYAEKISPDDLRLDWRRPASELERVVRLDRAWTMFRGERLLVLDARAIDVRRRDGADSHLPDHPDVGADAAPGDVRGTVVDTGDGLLELVSVQPAGKRPMGAAQWWRGVRATGHERLGDAHDDR